MDHAVKVAHVIGGMMFGGLASLFLVIETFFVVAITEQGSMWIPAGILCGSMALGGLLGRLLGDRFIDWMSAHWGRFWRHHDSFD
ncbi:MAG: hypothetical protein R3C49_04275 [Planctomycetaceae bacterium]